MFTQEELTSLRIACSERHQKLDKQVEEDKLLSEEDKKLLTAYSEHYFQLVLKIEKLQA